MPEVHAANDVTVIPALFVSGEGFGMSAFRDFLWYNDRCLFNRQIAWHMRARPFYTAACIVALTATVFATAAQLYAATAVAMGATGSNALHVAHRSDQLRGVSVALVVLAMVAMGLSLVRHEGGRTYLPLMILTAWTLLFIVVV